MVAIKSGPDIDTPAASDYFLPYQLDFILDEHRTGLIEKSVRIGWTYSDSFKNVRKRLHHANRDYLFATKDYPTALEYVQTAMKFVELFNVVRSVVSHGEIVVNVPGMNPDGSRSKFDEEVKIGCIKFDNGSRILAFTSNPAAMQAYGGDVGLDEFAKHKQQQALYGTAQGRITWGFDMDVWSAHWGETFFLDLARDARESKGGFEYYRKVTMQNAVDQGLVEKINEVSGNTFTREAFIEDCRVRARLPEIYAQEYDCEPTAGTAAIVNWEVIGRCKMDTPIERVHLESAEITRQFGEFEKATEESRKQKIQAYIAGQFVGTFARTATHRLGFDVAASGAGDLASIWVDSKEGSQLVQRALFTCRTEDWFFLKIVLFYFLEHLSALKGCGDETGLGKQICYEASKLYPGIFTGVNFKGTKHDMGLALMNQLSEANKRFPSAPEHKDIAADIYALRKIFAGGKWVFSESKNVHNLYSHCDMAWAAALSTKADEDNQVEFSAIILP